MTEIEKLRAERDALALQGAQMREALISCASRFSFYVGHHSANGDDKKAEDNQAYVDLTMSALALHDLSAEVVKRIKAGVLRKAAQDMRQADCDWPAVIRLNAMAAELDRPCPPSN